MPPPNAIRAWWIEEEAASQLQSATAAYSHLRHLDTRAEAYQEFLSHYTNRDLSQGTGMAAYHRAATSVSSNKYSRAPFNVIKLMIDTISARIAKFSPRPKYLTDEGDYGLRRRADRLQKWVDMQFYVNDVYDVAPKAFVDACIYGIGVLKTFRVGNEVRIERVFPGEILVDEHEAFYDKPHQLFQTKFVSKDVLKGMFPGHDDEIDTSEFISERANDNALLGSPLSDQVEVVEAWHLKSSPTASDGRRIVFVSGGVLVDEPYPHRDFPFSFVRWMHEPRGFYGIGLAEDLLGIHLDINTTIHKIERALELTASPQVWAQTGSGVSAKQITNIPGSVNFYSGQVPPKFFTPTAVPPDVFNYLNQQFQRAQQIARLSSTSMGSRIPSGLETGQAVRNFHDIETESFSLVAKQYERLFLDLAKKFVRTGKEIFNADKKYSVVLERDKNTVEKVPWKDVQLDDAKDAYVVKVFPSSSLSTSPSGRMADIQDLLNMGLISPEQGKRLLDFEDLENHFSLDRAAAENIDRILEQILEKNVYEPPEPFMDLQLGMKKAQEAVNKASRMGVPSSNVSKLRLFARQCSALMKRAQEDAISMQQGAQLQQAAPPPPDGSGQLAGAVTGQEL